MSKPIVGGILVARMGSTRLPSKAMALIEGKPVLEHIINRLKQAKTLDKIVVATTTGKEDRPILELAKKCGVESFAGSSADLLDRVSQAAQKNNNQPELALTVSQLKSH